MKREVAIDRTGKSFVEVETIGEREIFYNGKILNGQILTIEEQNILDDVIDDFEDGGNILEDGYEVLERNVFKIRRKVSMMKQVQVYFTNKFAAHMYSNSEYKIYSDPMHPEMYQIRMLDEVLVEGLFSKMERFFYQRMMESLALDAQEAIDEEMDRVGFIDDSDNTERFLDTLAEGLLAEIDEDFDNTDLDWLTYEMKNLMAEKYGKIGECDKAANYSGFFYKSDERFETIEEFLIAFGLIDEPEKYYYFIGHDWSEGKDLDEYFLEYQNIRDLADSFYEGDVVKALADDEYVFSQEEYEAWINDVETGGRL